MIFKNQGIFPRVTEFSLLSTFYNKTDDDVNFFVIISSGFGGAEGPGSEVQRFRVQRFRG